MGPASESSTGQQSQTTERWPGNSHKNRCARRVSKLRSQRCWHSGTRQRESIEKAPARKDKREKRKKKAKPRLGKKKKKGVPRGSKVEREWEDGAGQAPSRRAFSRPRRVNQVFPSRPGSQDRRTGCIHTKSSCPAQPTTARWVSPCTRAPVLLSLQPVGLPVGLQS